MAGYNGTLGIHYYDIKENAFPLKVVYSSGIEIHFVSYTPDPTLDLTGWALPRCQVDVSEGYRYAGLDTNISINIKPVSISSQYQYQYQCPTRVPIIAGRSPRPVPTATVPMKRLLERSEVVVRRPRARDRLPLRVPLVPAPAANGITMSSGRRLVCVRREN
eukprot:1195086-Prorocentrum_minimum.AAC.4